MSLFTTLTKTQTLDLLTDDGSRYLALFSTAPNPADGSGAVELSAGWYAREQLGAAGWSDDPPTSTGAIYRRSTAAVSFGPVTGADATVRGWGIYDAASGGNLLAFGPVIGSDAAASVLGLVSQSFRFEVGGIVLVVGGEPSVVQVQVPGDQVLILTTIKSANYTAAAGERVRYDASAAPFTLEAPPAPHVVGDLWGTLEVDDSSGAVTIDGNGPDIVDPSSNPVSDFVTTTPNAGLTWVWDGTRWAQI